MKYTGKRLANQHVLSTYGLSVKFVIMKDGPLRELPIKVYPDNVKVAILKMLKPFE